MKKANSQNSNYRTLFFTKKKTLIKNTFAKSALVFNYEPQYGYYGFNLYFPEKDKINIDSTLHTIKSFEKFISENDVNFDFDTIRIGNYINLDYRIFKSDLNHFIDQLLNDTEHCLNCFGLAVHQINIKKNNSQSIASLDIITVRLTNFEPIQSLKDTRVDQFGNLISIKGTIIKAGNNKIAISYLTFSCNVCTTIQVIRQIDDCFSRPTMCASKECKARSDFTVLRSSLFTKTTELQVIKVQEQIREEYDSGRVQRTMECELRDGLVSCCVPGDDVTITGIVKVHNNSGVSNKIQQSTGFSMYIKVINIVNNKDFVQGGYGVSNRILFTPKDYSAIQKIHDETDIFRTLVHSLNPNIYGHEIVKAGLLLALFGGTKSNTSRAESHVLIVGDPGLGKSEMLDSCTNVAPRGVYVCGNTSTSSGLTVTMTKDSSGEYAMEAGALMLADQGCCCIDEFDKMPTQHACLLEAMEQQSISIAKASTVCTLPTKAIILAAANPVGGHYNKSKTIVENLKISSPMLTRFDLIFIILDQANEELDQLVSKHVFAMHSRRSVHNPHLNISTSSTISVDNQLENRLKLKPREEINAIPHCLVRKYIAYAQKYVNPSLSTDAVFLLKEFYLKLRKEYKTGDSTPITKRQLDSLIRLTQAKAKSELREIATKADALDVIDIIKESLLEVFTDNDGILDTSRSQMGTGVSYKHKVQNLLNLLQEKGETESRSIFSKKEIRILSDQIGIPKDKFISTLESLNLQGYLLYKGCEKYQLITTDL